MRRMILLFVFLVQVASVCASYHPVKDGALADVCVSVVDDAGKPVSSALVSFVFYVAPEKAKIYEGETDSNGLLAAKNNCTGELRIWVRKKGYYETCIKPNLSVNSKEKITKTKRWMDQQLMVNVLLKKIHCPAKLISHWKAYWSPPVTNEFFGIDIEVGDWCAPYGKGKYEDFRIKYDYWNDTSRRLTWGCSIQVSMPNAADGFYVKKADAGTSFCYEYNADTNQVYQKNFDFTFDRTQRKIIKHEKFNEDEYLVFRTRSATNELGQIVKANYGRIDVEFSYLLGLSFVSWFNPIVNDTNLENEQN